MRGAIFLPLLLYHLNVWTGSKRKSEDRIIGGIVTEGDLRPPFMAIFNFKPSSTVKCTASIISPHWLISAAHCLVDKKHFETFPCMRNVRNLNVDAQCTRADNGDIIVNFPSQEKGRTPQVFVDVDDLMQVSESNYDHKKLVEKIIIHRDGYQGGMYGEYGGYDIILIKLSQPVSVDLAACLPGRNYRHTTGTWIGGYGRYRRVPCETTDLGPQLYEYCKVDPKCVQGSQAFQSAKCNVHFTFNGITHEQCIRDQPTPTAMDEECEAFRTSQGVSDKWMTKNDVNEIVILRRGAVKTICYRTDAGRHGWCGTTRHVITGKPGSHLKPDAEISSRAGWGVCSETCDETYREASFLTGKARVKPVEIMDQTWCDQRLERLRYGLEKPGQDRGFAVFPLVYCVAYNETYKTRFYENIGSRGYRKRELSRDLMKLLDREDHYYIRATGSCKGDSGGPLYELVDDQYVVIGTTSRGTGPIGNCGGQGNPTHYVRVQEMVPWIKTYVSNLCIV